MSRGERREVNAAERSDWERIRSSPFARMYVHELYVLALQAIEMLEAVFAEAKPPPTPTQSFLRNAAQVHANLSRAFATTARIRLLLEDRAKSRRQSTSQYEIQSGRASWLRELVSGIPLKAVMNPAIRDSLEHFDQRLDRLTLDSLRGAIPRPMLFPVDLIIGREATLKGHPIRVYFAEEQVFANMGIRVDVGALHGELVAIRDRLAPMLQENARSGKEAFIIVITDKTFDE